MTDTQEPLRAEPTSARSDPALTHYGSFAEAGLPADRQWTEEDHKRFASLMMIFDRDPTVLIRWDDPLPAAVAAVINAEASAPSPELIKELAGANEHLRGQIEGWTKEAEELQTSIDKNARENRELRSKLEALSGVNADLRTKHNKLMDEHYGVQIELARHQGYIDRVHALDVRPKESRSLKRLRRQQRTGPMTRDVDRVDGYGSAAEAPWYRRGQ